MAPGISPAVVAKGTPPATNATNLAPSCLKNQDPFQKLSAKVQRLSRNPVSFPLLALSTCRLITVSPDGGFYYRISGWSG